MAALELLSRQPAVARGSPLLFVHGAFTGAWCWDEHFLHFFAARGYPAHAVSLRGHGGSGGRDRLQWASLADYVSDLEAAVDRVPGAAVLVGHSMGGMVVQRYLENAVAPAAVLMASVPPHGLAWSGTWLAMTDPWLFHQLGMLSWLGPALGNREVLRRAVFSPDMPAHLVDRYFALCQGESQRVAVDMSGWDLPARPLRSYMPLLVLGAARDVLTTPGMVHATARRHGRTAEIVPDIAHAMMLEAGWQGVARRILAWLQAHEL